MKTTIGTLSCALVAVALAACHHDDTAPPRTAATESTTTTTSYQAEQQQPHQMQSPPVQANSLYSNEPTIPGAPATIGASENNEESTVHPATTTPKLDPALTNSEPGVSPRPVTGAGPTEPGPVNAKATDKKSPNAAAVTDQGNSKAEVQASARIRKALMASKTLSFGAKNVKVITQGSKVTLRGNVKTDAEKNEIAGIARNTDGITEVDDQLVVKP